MTTEFTGGNRCVRGRAVVEQSEVTKLASIYEKVIHGGVDDLPGAYIIIKIRSRELQDVIFVVDLEDPILLRRDFYGRDFVLAEELEFR